MIITGKGFDLVFKKDMIAPWSARNYRVLLNYLVIFNVSIIWFIAGR